MRQPEKFVCITYPQIDFLIPSDYVASCVGVKDLETSLLQNQDSGIFDFDEIASKFNQTPRESEIKTMIVLKAENENQVSVVTTQECRVSTIALRDFGLFSDSYAKQFEDIGLLACNFFEDRLRLLMDVRKTIDYMNHSLLEEL
ncbi:hypothetical protein [Treponema sp.]|uniref:hypothetical protein n=1 Tax=Treponema sp. TaxID=166 RepID=UPI00298D7449|nr:hypothetical protein [Treponema sp.]MCR5612414.1 hypothetical protein [Treponema sp.]